jgi:predicted HTH domain antitoxin
LLWHDECVPDEPTSEQIRREAEKLRDIAVELMEHAATLIAKSAELEKRILDRDKPKPSKKRMQ